MKKLFSIIIATCAALHLNAQQLNDKGLYITSDNELFSGTFTSINNGIKSLVNIKNGVVEGEATYYYGSGKVMETGMFTSSKKDQKWVRYTEGGTVLAIAFYSQGKKTGTWLVYDEQGKKRFEMNYADGEKAGIWTNWDENGVVVNTKNYSIAN